MKDLTIGIVGMGVVGAATARTYLEYVKEVICYDLYKSEFRDNLNKVIDESDITFLCLPTPQQEHSLACDTSVLEDFCNMLGGSKPNGNYVIKSTVPIGFTRKMSEEYGLINLVHSPEFLTARTAEADALAPRVNIIGSPCYRVEPACWKVLYDLYKARFPGVNTLIMGSDESEAVKLFTNAFFATKISFFNEINTLALKLDLDWSTILQGMLSDGRISHSHTQVPGPDGKRGWGGQCLPKDLANLIDCFRETQGVVPTICNAVLRRNYLDRNERDD